jgi:heme-degrading monooxygenase HmoA
VVRSVLYVRPRGGDHGSIVDFYRRHRILERAAEQDGCLATELQLPADGAGPILVTALWRDADAYQGWVDNPARAATAGDLSLLVDGELTEATRGELYDVVLAVPAVPGR